MPKSLTQIDWSKAVQVKETGFVIGTFLNPGQTAIIDLDDGYAGVERIVGANGAYRIQHPAGDENVIEAQDFERLFDPAKPTGRFNMPGIRTLFRKKSAGDTPWELVTLPQGGDFNENGKLIHVETGGGVVRSGSNVRAITAGDILNGYAPFVPGS